MERAKFIDEKLFKLTAALSLAVAAVGVASKAVLDAMPAGPLKVSVTVVLLYAIVSLFSGTLMGFPASGQSHGLDMVQTSPCRSVTIISTLPRR